MPIQWREANELAAGHGSCLEWWCDAQTGWIWKAAHDQFSIEARRRIVTAALGASASLTGLVSIRKVAWARRHMHGLGYDP